MVDRLARTWAPLFIVTLIDDWLADRYLLNSDIEVSVSGIFSFLFFCFPSIPLIYLVVFIPLTLTPPLYIHHLFIA
jgi:hypothetical protein